MNNKVYTPQTKDITCCSTCRKIYDTSPLVNMLCNGALKYSSISIYGDTYNLCPKCTSKLYNFIESISKF